MTLQQLKYIVAVAESGSLNKAAEKLYISQPTLTGAVKELESELGIYIFYRSGKGMFPTNDGTEFITYARQLYSQYEQLLERYGKNGTIRKKFGISTQHYSFAVKSFVEMVKKFNTAEYEFAIRETMTKNVIEDVYTSNSEVGIIYLSDFNRRVMTKLLDTHELEFHKLIECSAFVYLYRSHPLAKEPYITFDMLEPYPCLAFEQGSDTSFYFAEEILSTNNYPRIIKANDRATMLNLMVGLNGYTLCSGIICEELNGSDYIAVPFECGENNSDGRMEIGYIIRKNIVPGKMAELYINELKHYLEKQ